MSDRIGFFLDQHIPEAVTRGLERRGVDALSAQDAGRCGLSDLEQLEYARREQRVIVTFDDDFLTLAALGITHTGIAFSPASKYSIGELLRALLLIYEILTPSEMHNHIEFL